jgi:hypothetical protein
MPDPSVQRLPYSHTYKRCRILLISRLLLSRTCYIENTPKRSRRVSYYTLAPCLTRLPLVSRADCSR